MHSSRWGLLIGLLLCAQSVAAVEPSVPLRLALGHLPPVNCEDKATGPRCVNNKLAAKLQDLSGITIQTQLVPYARAPWMLQNKKADMALMLKNDNLPDDIVAIASVYEIKLSVYVREGVDHSSRAALRVGVLRGRGNNINERLAGFRLVELSDYQQAVDMLALSRLDAVLVPDEALAFLFEEYLLTGRFYPQPILQFGQEVWLYCRKDACDARQQRQLQQAVTELEPYMPTLLKVMPTAYYE